MSSTDFYGYKTNIQNEQLSSSDNAIIDIGNGQLGLVQQWSGSYNHAVEQRFEFGSSTVYWVNGRPSGQFHIQKLVGREGLLTAFRTGQDACGGLRQIAVSLDGGSCSVEVGPGLIFSGAKLSQVAVSGQAGAFELAEQATFVVASMA